MRGLMLKHVATISKLQKSINCMGNSKHIQSMLVYEVIQTYIILILSWTFGLID